MQVVTSENMQQLIETGKVDEFKPPEAPKASEAKLRGEDGKFVSVEPGKETVDTVSEKDDKQATADLTAEVKADDKPGEESDDDDLPEKVRKKIGAKHRQMKEAEEFGEREFARRKAAEREAEELREQLKAAREGSKSGPQPTKDSNEPKPDDFKTVAEYADALVDYKLNQRDQKAEEKRQAAAQSEVQKALQGRIAKAAEEISDYTEVMSKADIDAPGHIAQYLAESEMGPQVGYHLVKNRSEYDRISQLSPIRAIAELGKLETRLTKSDAPKAKDEEAKAPAVSKAPSPITPLDASRVTKVETDPSKMSLQELREYERQKSRESHRR